MLGMLFLELLLLPFMQHCTSVSSSSSSSSTLLRLLLLILLLLILLSWWWFIILRLVFLTKTSKPSTAAFFTIIFLFILLSFLSTWIHHLRCRLFLPFIVLAQFLLLLLVLFHFEPIALRPLLLIFLLELLGRNIFRHQRLLHATGLLAVRRRLLGVLHLVDVDEVVVVSALRIVHDNHVDLVLTKLQLKLAIIAHLVGHFFAIHIQHTLGHILVWILNMFE
mmetsp:Transcript_50136/g.83504  ORF Transcript_50136/g.83504 Transcript_50136/m.83504 type:complete len:222 (+) Transcript_50136:972-1637(+)